MARWGLLLAYLGLVVATLAGFLAPFVPAYVLPALQVLPAIIPLAMPLHGVGALVLRQHRLGRWAALMALALSAWMAMQSIAWRLPRDCDAAQGLRIVSYNAAAFEFDREDIDSAAVMLNSLRPDIVCFQEFRNTKLRNGLQADQRMADRLGLTHFAFMALPTHIQGLAIHSRYPILRIDTLFMHRVDANAGALVTILTPQGPVGVAVLHNHSFHLSALIRRNQRLGDLVPAAWDQAGRVIRRQEDDLQRSLAVMARYPYPLVLAADMNAVPHSRTIELLRRQMRDSFQAAGSGIGYTYFFLRRIGIRIDYQFCSGGIEPVACCTYPSYVSDHFPVMGVYRLVAPAPQPTP